jgi:hypothetical protein
MFAVHVTQRKPSITFQVQAQAQTPRMESNI